jgi:hypothetical protein
MGQMKGHVKGRGCTDGVWLWEETEDKALDE